MKNNEYIIELNNISKSFGDKVIGVEPYGKIWTDRPKLPVDEVFIQPLELAGETAASKIGRIRAEGIKSGADAVLVSMLDEVAWTLNLRGSDIEFNPVFVSYLLITADKATLYINQAKLTAEVSAYLKAEGVDTKPYGEMESDLRNLACKVLVQPDKTKSFLPSVGG